MKKIRKTIGQMPWKLGKERTFTEGSMDTILDANGNVIAFFPAYANEVREKVIYAMEAVKKAAEILGLEPGVPPKDSEISRTIQTCSCSVCKQVRKWMEQLTMLISTGKILVSSMFPGPPDHDCCEFLKERIEKLQDMKGGE